VALRDGDLFIISHGNGGPPLAHRRSHSTHARAPHGREMFAKLTGRRFSLQDENRELVERLMTYKSKDAEKLNEENDHQVR